MTLIPFTDLKDIEVKVFTFSNQRSALRSRDDESEGDWRLGDTRSCDNVVQVLLELVTNKTEGSEDAGTSPCHCHYPLRTGAICYIDLGTTLQHCFRY